MNKKRYILVVSIILIGVFSLVLLNSKLDNKQTKLDEVKLKENKVDKKSFAIMIQKEDKTGYEVYNDNTWPTNMIYNNELSGCIDNYGSIIENSLTYNQETNKVTINTGVTSSCYLYFDLDKDAPIVTSSVNNNNSTNATMTISSNESGTYCVNTSNTITDISNCVFTGNITKDVSVTTSVFTTKGDYYVHVKDNAGNIGISSKVSIVVGNPLWEYIIDNSISGLQKTIITGDDLYRFSGTSGNTGINNYICLGTTSKCSSGTDYMYRIIGVNPTNGEIKVIKETPWNSSTLYSWHSSNSNISWLTSSLYTGTVKEIYDSLSFKNIIVTNHIWNVGTVGNTSIATREGVVDYENNLTGTSNIGILSLTDYYLAYNEDRNWYSSYDKTTNWIGGYFNGNTSKSEWTMTYYGLYSSYYRPWYVLYNYGRALRQESVEGTHVIRPTFFLNSNVNWKSGTGTSGDPFIIN